MSDGTLPEELFTSGLSGGEFLLVREAGFEPVGVVMGSSVCHVGPRRPAPSSDGPGDIPVPEYGGEVTGLTHSMGTGWTSAMSRLEDDARDLGADGVIGIGVETARHSWYDGAHELIMTGTAIRRAGGRDRDTDRGPASDPERRVFTSGLSGQDFWALLRSGHCPVGLISGYCAYAPEPDRPVGNRELRRRTHAVYTARERAMDRMRARAAQLGASGIVDVRLDGLDGLGRLRDGGILECRATGTAVTELRGAPGMGPTVPGLSL